MKVLLLTQVLPYPPDSGPKVKTFYVLKYLARQHQVTLVSFVRGDQIEHIQELKAYCQEIYTVPMRRSLVMNLAALGKSLVGNNPWMMARDDLKEMRALVDRLATQVKFDVAHADQLNMAPTDMPGAPLIGLGFSGARGGSRFTRATKSLISTRPSLFASKPPGLLITPSR